MVEKKMIKEYIEELNLSFFSCSISDLSHKLMKLERKHIESGYSDVSIEAEQEWDSVYINVYGYREETEKEFLKRKHMEEKDQLEKKQKFEIEEIKKKHREENRKMRVKD